MRGWSILLMILMLTPIAPLPAAADTGPEGSELGYWRLDGEDHDVPSAGLTGDASGNGLHLTRVNGPTARASPDVKWGGGYDFDGGNDYLKSTSPALRLAGDLSVLIVFEKDTASTQQDLVTWGAVGDSLATNILYMLSIQPNGILYYFHEHGAGADTFKYTDGPIAPGFHVLSLRRDAIAKTVEVKVDGEFLIGGASATPPAYGNNPAGGTSGFFTVGSREAASGRFLNGGVYELRMWDRALSWEALDAFARRSAVPGVPTVTAARGDAAGEIDLAWEPPADDGDLAIEQYDVYRDDVWIAATSPAVRTFTDTGLAAGSLHAYTLAAANALGPGIRSAPASARAPDVPSAPMLARGASGPGAGAITLAWDPPASDGGLPIAEYRVYTGDSLLAETSELTLVDTGLPSGSHRSYTIRAVNAAGEGAAAIAGGSTFPPPEGPRSLFAQKNGPGSLRLSWAAPADDGGLPVAAYRVYADGGLLSETAALDLTETELGPGRTRTYEVTAVTDAGESARAGPVAATTFALPGAPPVAVERGGAGELRVAWSFPDTDGLPASFRVYVDGALAADTFGLAYAESDLPPATTRTYQVSAVTDAGEGPRSAPALGTTHALPTAARALSAARGDAPGEIDLAWLPPEDASGLAVTYLVFAGDASPEALLAITADLSFTESGLPEGAHRTYVVVPRTDAGDGPASDAADAAAPTRPAAPLDLASDGASPANVTWRAPDDDGGLAIVGYRVYRTTGSEVTLLAETARTWFVDDAPASGTGWRVTALNAAGESAFAWIGFVPFLPEALFADPPLEIPIDA